MLPTGGGERGARCCSTGPHAVEVVRPIEWSGLDWHETASALRSSASCMDEWPVYSSLRRDSLNCDRLMSHLGSVMPDVLFGCVFVMVISRAARRPPRRTHPASQGAGTPRPHLCDRNIGKSSASAPRLGFDGCQRAQSIGSAARDLGPCPAAFGAISIRTRAGSLLAPRFIGGFAATTSGR